MNTNSKKQQILGYVYTEVEGPLATITHVGIDLDGTTLVVVDGRHSDGILRLTMHIQHDVFTYELKHNGWVALKEGGGCFSADETSARECDEIVTAMMSLHADARRWS